MMRLRNKQKATVGGRSFVFNALFVLINLIGLTLVVMGSHKNFEEQFMLFSFIGWILIALTGAGLFIFQGRLMMSNVSRVLVGGLFIVSGLVKANDPLGFSYKLEEYFEDGALAFRIKEWFGAPGFSLEFLIEWALVLSVIICVVEIVLGVLTIIGGKIKLVSYLLMLMMLFFTFLTWHTANCDSSMKFTDRDTYEMSNPIAAMKIEEAKTNKEIKIISKDSKELVIEELKQPQCVDDCGCFGDAMKGSVGRSLTPKESMWKDIVLVYLVFWIFVAQWIIEPNTKSQNIKFIIASTGVVVFFSWVFGWYFPIFFALFCLIGGLWILRAGGFFLGNYWGTSLIVSLFSFVFVTYVLMYEPMKDYRPYAEGSDLVKMMNDGIEGKYESMLVYKNKKTGEKIEYNSTSQEYIDSKIWEQKDWEYLEMTQKEIIPSRIPSITDQFNPFLAVADVTEAEMKLEAVKAQFDNAYVDGYLVMDLAYNSEVEVPASEFTPDGYPDTDYKVIKEIKMPNPEFTEISLRDYITTADRVVMLSVKNLTEANWNQIERYKEIYYGCKKANIPFVLVCNGSREQINEFRSKNKWDVPVFLNDETELKAIARSNPSLLLIGKGIVKGKYPHRSTPTWNWIKTNVFK
ncbi:MAG: DoxX family protein [Bacteroidetes bacterium]|nr:MAG: DoxX family protein [Bacteroidota bacterium]